MGQKISALTEDVKIIHHLIDTVQQSIKGA